MCYILGLHVTIPISLDQCPFLPIGHWYTHTACLTSVLTHAYHRSASWHAILSRSIGYHRSDSPRSQILRQGYLQAQQVREALQDYRVNQIGVPVNSGLQPAYTRSDNVNNAVSRPPNTKLTTVLDLTRLGPVYFEACSRFRLPEFQSFQITKLDDPDPVGQLKKAPLPGCNVRTGAAIQTRVPQLFRACVTTRSISLTNTGDGLPSWMALALIQVLYLAGKDRRRSLGILRLGAPDGTVGDQRWFWILAKLRYD